MRRPAVAALLACALAGCAAGPVPVTDPALRARLSRPQAAQRAIMVARIGVDLRREYPSLAGPALDRALAAVGAVRREAFVTPAGRSLAYLDAPQDIGWGQTISDPYVVTLMTAALDLPPGAAVLDVGTGSGFQAAVLSHLASRVRSVEIVPGLAAAAAKRLRRLGYRNVEVRTGDGFDGAPDAAPFDGIVVAAGAAVVPEALIRQLRPGGRLVMPVGAAGASEQILVLTRRPDGGASRCSLGWAMFVPLTGRGARPPGAFGLIDRTIPRCTFPTTGDRP